MLQCGLKWPRSFANGFSIFSTEAKANAPTRPSKPMEFSTYQIRMKRANTVKDCDGRKKRGDRVRTATGRSQPLCDRISVPIIATFCRRCLHGKARCAQR